MTTASACRLAGQIADPGPDVLAEQDTPSRLAENGSRIVKSGLRRPRAAGRQRVRGQQHRRGAVTMSKYGDQLERMRRYRHQGAS